MSAGDIVLPFRFGHHLGKPSSGLSRSQYRISSQTVLYRPLKFLIRSIPFGFKFFMDGSGMVPLRKKARN